MPYFRFCQTIDAIYKRIDSERKHNAMVQEIATKFIASIIASTSPLTEKGALILSDKISKFSIVGSPKKPKKPEKPKKKELPVGGYEMAMNFFSGMGE